MHFVCISSNFVFLQSYTVSRAVTALPVCWCVHSIGAPVWVSASKNHISISKCHAVLKAHIHRLSTDESFGLQVEINRCLFEFSQEINRKLDENKRFSDGKASNFCDCPLCNSTFGYVCRLKINGIICLNRRPSGLAKIHSICLLCRADGSFTGFWHFAKQNSS